MGAAPLLILAAMLFGNDDLSRLSELAIKDRGELAFAEGVRHRDDPDAARPHFRAAALCFAELHRRGASNATLFRNLGHSYLLAGDLPQAILAYRRGLRLAPSDQALADGLRAARAHVTHTGGSQLGQAGPEGRSFRMAWLRGEWLVAGAALLYAAACIGLTRWLMTRRGLLLVVALLALLGAGLMTAGAVHGMAGKPAGPLVVIAEDGVLLRRGDSLSYPPRYETPINRGVEGCLLAERGGWVQIELPGGETGWVMREYVLVDEERG